MSNVKWRDAFRKAKANNRKKKYIKIYKILSKPIQ